jgi:hypothetical protein
MEQEKVYKCIKKFSVEKCDEYENFLDDEYFVVPVDSEWLLQEHAFMSDVRLENDELGWLEIAFEDLKSHFVEI